jgi:hypothetical protein
VTDAVAERLAAMFGVIALGAGLTLLTRWWAHRTAHRTAAEASSGSAPAAPARDAAARVTDAVAQLTTFVLIPALLFRTMARLDLTQMPWPAVTAYFVPLLSLLLAVTWAFTRRPVPSDTPAPQRGAIPATRATAAVYGNAVQLGIPLAAGIFGETGLALHLALVSLHSLLALTLLTVLAEAGIVRSRSAASHPGAATRLLPVLGTMVVRSLWHPVVLPIVLGLLWNLGGFGLHPLVDRPLALLAVLVVPLCLLLIGSNLVQYGWRHNVQAVLPQLLVKLLLLPAAVLLTARLIFGQTGLALQVLVLMAALPTGTNALIFAQRYRMLQGEATTAIVLSTAAFIVTAPAWLWVLQRWA